MAAAHPPLFLEVKRKSIHLFALIIPIGLYAFPANVSLWILSLVCAASLAVEALRLNWEPARTIFLKVFSPLLRKHELRKMTGSTYIQAAAVLCAVFLADFRSGVALSAPARTALFLSFSFIILGDAAAALVGKRFGKRKIFGDKTWVGTLACFATGLLIFWVFKLVTANPVSFWVGAACAAATAFLEVLPHKWDDNFVVPPLTCGLTYFLLKNRIVP